MALRQTTGFVESMLRLVSLDWTVPDFSALSRRQKSLTVNIPYRGLKGPLHLLIDSTGTKVEGEWRACKHSGPKRRVCGLGRPACSLAWGQRHGRGHCTRYAKLPPWFKVPTPLGSYNPDWAVLVEDNGQEKLYFVVETKSSSWWDDLRHKEGAKIKCGERHFAVLAEDEDPAQYIKSTSVDDMLKHV